LCETPYLEDFDRPLAPVQSGVGLNQSATTRVLLPHGNLLKATPRLSTGTSRLTRSCGPERLLEDKISNFGTLMSRASCDLLIYRGLRQSATVVVLLPHDFTSKPPTISPQDLTSVLSRCWDTMPGSPRGGVQSVF
jgi:hypothetical protein